MDGAWDGKGLALELDGAAALEASEGASMTSSASGGEIIAETFV